MSQREVEMTRADTKKRRTSVVGVGDLLMEEVRPRLIVEDKVGKSDNVKEGLSPEGPQPMVDILHHPQMSLPFQFRVEVPRGIREEEFVRGGKEEILGNLGWVRGEEGRRGGGPWPGT